MLAIESIKIRPKIDNKYSKINTKSTKRLHESILEASWAQDGPKMVPRGFSKASPAVRLALGGSQVEGPNFVFMLQSHPERSFEGHRRPFFRAQNMDPNIEGSWERFLMNLLMVSGGVVEAKKGFSLERGYNFHIFSDLNISCHLDSQKCRFRLRFGGQVGVQKCTSWLQEASWADEKAVLEGPEIMSGSSFEKCRASRCR